MMIKSELEFFYFEIEQAPLRGVHKLRLQDLAFFDHLPTLHFLWYKSLQKVNFFDHLPPSVYIFYGIKVHKKSIF